VCSRQEERVEGGKEASCLRTVAAHPATFASFSLTHAASTSSYDMLVLLVSLLSAVDAGDARPAAQAVCFDLSVSRVGLSDEVGHL
jgi:hypothetical protein